MQGADHFQHGLWDTILLQCTPQSLAGYGIVRLLEVNEEHKDFSIMLNCLLHQLPSTLYHVNTTPATTEPTLRVMQHLLSHRLKQLLDNLGKHLSPHIQKTNASQLSHKDKSPFFGIGTIRASFHSWGTHPSCKLDGKAPQGALAS